MKAIPLPSPGLWRGGSWSLRGITPAISRCRRGDAHPPTDVGLDSARGAAGLGLRRRDPRVRLLAGLIPGLSVRSGSVGTVGSRLSSCGGVGPRADARAHPLGRAGLLAPFDRSTSVRPRSRFAGGVGLSSSAAGFADRSRIGLRSGNADPAISGGLADASVQNGVSRARPIRLRLAPRVGYTAAERPQHPYEHPAWPDPELLPLDVPRTGCIPCDAHVDEERIPSPANLADPPGHRGRART